MRRSPSRSSASSGCRRGTAGSYASRGGEVRLVDFQALEGPVKKVRRALGASAFGVNFFDLPPGFEGREHDEAERDQEEVYVYVGGSGTLRLDGETVDVREGMAVRVDPEVTRQPIAGDDGLAWVAIGAPRDGRYEPPEWG